MTFDLPGTMHRISNWKKSAVGVGLALGVAACGVQGHPHGDAAPINTSCDFGCAGVPVGAGGFVGAGAGFPVGPGGFAPGAGGGFPSAGTTFGAGGYVMPGAGGFVPG